MKARAMLLLALLAAALPLHAGLWDRDRPGDSSVPSVFDVISGRFDRYPSEYYQLRAQRLETELAKLPEFGAGTTLTPDQLKQVADALPAMDDAAVAFYRQGDFARAIILLDRKNRLAEAIRAERTATAKQEAYRAVANKAACLAARARANPGTPDLRDARDLLAAAVKDDPYNADAQWTLAEIEWLLSEPTYAPGDEPLFPNLLGLTAAAFRGARNSDALARNKVAGCIPYLCRRVAYEGTDNIDLMYALSLALELSGRHEEAVLAWLKICELVDNGAVSDVANAPAARGLKRAMGVHLGEIYERDAAEKLYAELTSQAEAWRQSRLKYLEANLKNGRHPDTDPAFWAGWSLQDPAVIQPGQPPEDAQPAITTALLVAGIGGLVFVLCLLLVFILFLGRNKSPHPNVNEI